MQICTKKKVRKKRNNRIYSHYVAILLYIQVDVRTQYNQNINQCLLARLLDLRECLNAPLFQEHLHVLWHFQEERKKKRKKLMKIKQHEANGSETVMKWRKNVQHQANNLTKNVHIFLFPVLLFLFYFFLFCLRNINLTFYSQKCNISQKLVDDNMFHFHLNFHWTNEKH